eukprot:gnl/TRDRNA2_/TRDRNA2_165575_c0_seq2.p1 gnl/TRDRNA2_/TRDRNA2_165575_c0~~gnl/TRDRNA2_/TRDRNA2_165575_c0_seq2.p1  ORF type:complete len:296 (-),score=42.45 gnl/TRDRNA2_/TRDRNA2_165575_c0_seq2:59-889(-)
MYPAEKPGSKLFLGGLSAETTKEVIEAHFSAYGVLTDAVVMYEGQNSKGFGFVTFAQPAQAALAQSQPHVIDGRTIEVSYAQGRGGAAHFVAQGQSNWSAEAGKTQKIFVGGLPQKCDEDGMKAYFGKYGCILDAVVMKDHTTGRSKGFGFVTFDDCDSVERVMAEYDNHRMVDKWIEVKRAQPKDEKGGKKGGGKKGNSGLSSSPAVGKGWGNAADAAASRPAAPGSANAWGGASQDGGAAMNPMMQMMMRMMQAKGGYGKADAGMQPAAWAAPY